MKKKSALVLGASSDKLFAVGTFIISLMQKNPSFTDDIIVFYYEITDEQRRRFSSIGSVILKKYDCPFANAAELSYFTKELFTLMVYTKYECIRLLSEYHTVIWMDYDMFVLDELSEPLIPVKEGVRAIVTERVEDSLIEGATLPSKKRINGIHSSVFALYDTLRDYEKIYDFCIEKTVELTDLLKCPEQAVLMQTIITNLNSIKSVSTVVKKMEELALAADEEPEGLKVCREGGVTVEYKNLSVKYEGHAVVNDLSFRFEAGKKYLIVGKNGCGKSTMFKTLKKRIPEYSGDITVNGVSFNDISGAELCRCVSYLNERVSLFSGKGSENITLFRETDAESFKNAVTQAQVNIDLSRTINDGGVNISSGEQRRIEIARSLIESVDFIVFDEVISTLDIETAYEIEKMILGYKDKTIVFISHNFSGLLMKEYDEIIYMDDGRIIAHGPFNEITKNEQFKHILKIKFGDLISV